MFRRPLNPGDQVIIIWSKDKGNIRQEATFVKYTKGIIAEDTPLFVASSEYFLGENCFWLRPKHVKKSSDIVKYQKLLHSLQLRTLEMAEKTNQQFVSKISDNGISEKQQEIKANVKKMKQFIEKYGFDPTDESWIERHLASTPLEEKWFQFTRLQKMPVINEEIVTLFNEQNKENITLRDALKMTAKKVRYIFGSMDIRYRGENRVDKWKQAAIDFEKKFIDREERMRNWALSRNGNFPFVTTLKPVEFWPGNMFYQCIERIPDIIFSPDCTHIKAGITLEVFGFDPQDKWIDLDFTEDIRERLTGKKERAKTSTYSIIVRPNELSMSLSGIEVVEKEHKRIQFLEQGYDQNRSSSGLTPRGENPETDK